MGNKKIIHEIISNIGWWLYWRSKWQDNQEWREKLSPNTLLGRQIRDNLAYFIRNGLED